MSAFQVLYGKITQKNDIVQVLSPCYTFFVYSLYNMSSHSMIIENQKKILTLHNNSRTTQPN